MDPRDLGCVVLENIDEADGGDRGFVDQEHSESMPAGISGEELTCIVAHGCEVIHFGHSRLDSGEGDTDSHAVGTPACVDALCVDALHRPPGAPTPT